MFWKDKPLNEEIPLQDLTKVIRSKDRYDFRCYGNEQRHVLLQFINEHYFHQKARFKFVYEESHLEFFLREGGWISIHSKKFPDAILGVVAYRHVCLNTDEKTSEVDFLCVKPSLRNINLAEFLINKVTQVLIQKGLYTCFFTGMDKRNEEYFCKKKVLLYIINFKKLLEMRYIPPLLMENTSYIDDCIYYKECKSDEDYIGIADCFNEIYRKELLRREDIFIDFIVFDKTYIFCRFMKVKVKCRITGDILNSVILYYANGYLDQYINNLAWLLREKHGVDFITLYDPFEKTLEKRQVFNTGLFMYYYSYNKKVTGVKSCSLNPV